MIKTITHRNRDRGIVNYLFILSFILLFHFSSAKEIQVGKTFSVHTIHEAIAIADSGDVIIIYEGKYVEGNLIINKPITLCSNGVVVIDGKHEKDVITITAHDVVIDGFTIQNSGKSDLKEFAGIHIINANSCFISNCTLLNNYFGMYLDNCSSCIILHNTITGGGGEESSAANGIQLWKCDKNFIAKNHVSNHRDGIYFEFVTNTFVIENLSEHNLRYGIHFMFSNHDDYVKNIFRENGSGVAVMYSSYVNIIQNIFDHNRGDASYGLLLKELTSSRIIGNTFVQNTIGIFLEGTSRSFFSENTFQNNGWAFRIYGDCYSDTILANNFFSNTFDVATNAGENENFFSKNYWDKYTGYDLNKDGVGDVPFHPVSLYSKLVEVVPNSILLMHSFLVNILDETEKVIPSITPKEFRDESPHIKPNDYAAG